MIYIYFFIASLPFVITSLFIKKEQDAFLAKLMIVIYVLIYGLNYRVAVDWYAYEPAYYGNNLLEFEYGYTLLQKLFYSLGVDFWFFVFFIKIFFWVACYKVTKQYSKYVMAPLFFLTMISPIFLTDFLRQLIATSIFFITLLNIQHKSTLKFTLITCIAALFHISALLVLPFYFVYRYRLLRNMLLIVVIAFFFINMTNFSPINAIVQLLTFFLSGPFYDKLLLYASVTRNPMTIGYLIRFIILISYYIYFRKIINENNNVKVIWCSLLFSIGYEMIFYDINTLWTRSREYFLIFLPIAILSFNTYFKINRMLLFLLLLIYSTNAFSGLSNNNVLWNQYGRYCNYAYMLINDCHNYKDSRYNETKYFWETRVLNKGK
ncbi:hypothetical protein B9T12_06520 [Wohlfahrtiimonas chitiniclastica]|uniref:EpsG family protein n=1 Tax=Wohlfahrtiimonas chitiniclastica TaxID=400946 RepID=UPI000B97E90B|nr:EpsG family protein [Wohlfahrtiimonas chitiniclastica]OYQ77613.1 hypothetical protein B9T12_06520 [Wohlfahrtiimonas chitiniclastica]